MKIQNVFLYFGTFLVIQSLIREDQRSKEYNAVSSGQFTSKMLFRNGKKRNFVFINANDNTKVGAVNFIRLEFGSFLACFFLIKTSPRVYFGKLFAGGLKRSVNRESNTHDMNFCSMLVKAYEHFLLQATDQNQNKNISFAHFLRKNSFFIVSMEILNHIGNQTSKTINFLIVMFFFQLPESLCFEAFLFQFQTLTTRKMKYSRTCFHDVFFLFQFKCSFRNQNI